MNWASLGLLLAGVRRHAVRTMPRRALIFKYEYNFAQTRRIGRLYNATNAEISVDRYDVSTRMGCGITEHDIRVKSID